MGSQRDDAPYNSALQRTDGRLAFGSRRRFDDANLVDLRLGRKAIRTHRDDELKDPRVTIRGQSDWVNIRVASSEDVEFVVRLVRDILVE